MPSCGSGKNPGTGLGQYPLEPSQCMVQEPWKSTSTLLFHPSTHCPDMHRSHLWYSLGIHSLQSGHLVADDCKLFQYWVAPSPTRWWRWWARLLLCLQWQAGCGNFPDWCRCNAAVHSCLLLCFFMIRELTACWHAAWSWRVFLSVARPIRSTSVLNWTPFLFLLCNMGISYLEHRDSIKFRKISSISQILCTIPGA